MNDTTTGPLPLTAEGCIERINVLGRALARMKRGEQILALPGEDVEHAARRAVAPEHLTDLGNAQQLVQEHGHDLRYCRPWGSWLVWDGMRWAKDDTSEVVRRAKAIARSLYGLAAQLGDDHQRRALALHAAKSESEARIEAMIRLAASEPGIPVTPEQLDADSWKLNVLNGTLDLRTGELHEHRRADLHTKLAPVAYDPEAPCPTWRAFLDRVFDGDTELIRFMQKAVGYALTGDTSEQCLFILYGTGANGKSTFLTTVGALLGDYSRQTPTETLLVKRGDSISNDVARLHGARFVSAVEAEGGRRLAEALVKQLTGGDKITARFLHREFFEFKPTFKVFLAVNHKPTVQGTDHAIWRRIRLVPFTVTIPPEEQDRALPAKLHAELPGILRWAVEGCLAWQREGLEMPPAVRRATKEYRAEMDVFAEFLDAHCEEQPGAWVSTSKLYAAYAGWCQQTGERQMAQRVFALALKERGFEPTKRRHERGWRGLRLREDEEGDL